ncbi:MAG: ABC transporter substrate-binding protein [Actinomycetes bacterium]
MVSAPSKPAQRRRIFRTLAAAAVIALGGAALTACSSASGSSNTPELRLGYFANLTHALPVLGVSNGQYQKALGSTKLTTSIFNAGPSAIEALNAGSIDAAYIGPNPAINGWSQSNGTSLRIVSGATSAGAAFIVKPTITADNASLKGKTFATPQLGNTQDVSLRYWLKQKGLTAPKEGGGDVNIAPQDNAQTLDLFKQGKIDGAWVPEPWASRLVLEGGGKELVNEASLWPNGQFVTTQLIVSQTYLEQHPDQVKALLTGELDTLATIKANPITARDAINKALESLSGKALPQPVIERAWPNLTVTLDPIATSLAADQAHAEAVGISKPIDLKGIYDLSILNALLAAKGQAAISAGDLAKQ